jgi:nucleotide-binding universal stress UspA family protein
MMALRAILSPIDFSDQARHALRWAEALASRHQSRLLVLTAVDPLLAEAAKVHWGTDLATTEAESALREFVTTTWPGETTHRDAVFCVRVGDPASVILDTATVEGVDLIVMGTHGLGGLRKWLLGSTTERVLRRTRTPVLAVPAVAGESEALAVQVTQLTRSVLATTDLSEASIHAIRWAEQIATAHGVPLLLAHVVEPLVVAPQWRSYVQDTGDARIAAARERLAQFAQQLGSTACATIVSLGRPEDAIASVAEEQNAGLIVMGLGGGPGFLAARPGSTAYRVLCVSSIPILVVPPESVPQPSQ